MTTLQRELENILNGTLMLFKARYGPEIQLINATITLLKSDDVGAEECEHLRLQCSQLDRLPIDKNVSQQQLTALTGTRKRVKELVTRTLKHIRDAAIDSSAASMASGSGEGGDTEEYYLDSATQQFNKAQQVNLEVNKMITRAEADVKRWLDGKLGKSLIDKTMKDLSYEVSKMNDKMRGRYNALVRTVAQPPVKSSSRDDDWLNDSPTTTAPKKTTVTATKADDDDDWY